MEKYKNIRIVTEDAVLGNHCKEHTKTFGCGYKSFVYPYTVSFWDEGKYEVIIKGKKAVARKIESDKSNTEGYKVNINKTIDAEDIRRTIQVLIDNGIDESEAGVVLNAIGYTLLDAELDTEGYEMNEEG